MRGVPSPSPRCLRRRRHVGPVRPPGRRQPPPAPPQRPGPLPGGVGFPERGGPRGGARLSPPAHARCALRLLRCLPPARHAALQHLRAVFDEQLGAHLLRAGGPAGGPAGAAAPPASPGLDEVVREARRILAEFIRAKPSAWAPVVSAWAVELMGQLSSKYAGRAGPARGGGPGGAPEALRLWLSCEATRALLEIYGLCLSAMMGGCPDACVDALLDTSVRHAPHFDWVVAHIGSSFPNTIVARVLSCGLKDFCARPAAPGELLLLPPAFPAGCAPAAASSSSSSSSASSSSSSSSSLAAAAPKLASVVGILGHLAARHSGSIKQELLRLFHESLAPGAEPQRAAAVPFLLQLAVMAPALLGAVCPDLVESLKPPVLNQLHQRLATLPREDLDAMVAVVVHLICQSSAGAYRILQFLVDTAMPASVITAPGGPPLHEGVREACDRLVRLLLLQLQKLVYERGAGPDAPPRAVPFLDALGPHVRELCVETLRLERKRFLWQHQLLALVAVYSAPHGAADALFFLLALARTPEELALAAQLHAVLGSCLPDPLPAAAAACVRQLHAGRLPEPQAARLCRNLALAARAEAPDGGPAPMGARLAAALARHLGDLAPLLLHRHAEVAAAACLLLSACPPPRAAPPAQLLPAVRAAARRFFLALRRRRPAELGQSGRLLARLSAVSPAAGRAVLRQLVEGALRRGNAELFGGTPLDDANLAAAAPAAADVSLLDVNRRFTAAVNFAGGVWSVFHAGVIGRGPKAAAPAAGPERRAEEPERNTQTFLTLLLRCCRAARGPDAPPGPPGAAVDPEAAKAVAAALVESVCPEAAGADPPWPPEDQARGTLERDLRICRRFRAQPLLFPLLRLVAAGPPALCYCAGLLRGLLAALLAFWEACRESRTAGAPWHLRASCALVAVLAEGSLLPPPLANVHELFGELAPFEVRLLLLSVWGYLRENGPLPQRFAFRPERRRFCRDFSRDADPAKHLAVLHSVLHRNIHRLGGLAARFRT